MATTSTNIDDGVASRVAAITSGNSDLMKLARTQGIQSANRRGLGNSSMAVQAGVLNAATPIASQDAQAAASWQTNEANLAADWQKTQAALAADQQKTMASALTDLTSQRFNALSNTLNNAEIPSATRAAVQSSINDQYTQGLDYLQKLYGVSFVPTAASTPAASSATGLGTYLNGVSF